jgi:hypothetical protein
VKVPCNSRPPPLLQDTAMTHRICLLSVMAMIVACGDSGSTSETTATTPGTDTTQPPPTTTTTPTTDADTTAQTGTDGETTSPTITPTGTTVVSESSSDTTVVPTTTDVTTTDATTTDDPTETTGGVDCLPPDALIVFDRSQTMGDTPAGLKPIDAPNYASSKWAQAIGVVETLVAPPLDSTIRFGLELWPRDPGGDACVTLAAYAGGSMASNPLCEVGEIVLESAADNGPEIVAALDPLTTTLCQSTPTGTALYTARDQFTATKEPGRDQYAILITDGADWELTCPDPSPLTAVQDLVKDGVKTYVVGFSAEADPGAVGFLNDLACAGQTAINFPGPCQETADGWVALDPISGVPLYLQADNKVQLNSALTAVAGELCCGCQPKCEAPDVLFALDRTLTMTLTPNGDLPGDPPAYESSRWSQAITAIEQVVTSNLDDQLRFGLELWPRDPGGGQCVTQAEQIQNLKVASNPMCQVGEIVVPPGLGAGATIEATLNPATTPVCFSTPTGAGLQTASEWLIDNSVPGRKQYIVLVTDGADWATTCPDPSPLLVTQQHAAAGIKTYVVGFFDEEVQDSSLGFLNDLACAGLTAPDFEVNCVLAGGGYVASDPTLQTPLYLQAGDGALAENLQSVADEILQFCVPG